MTTKPVPSTDPADLVLNAGILDEAVNSTAQTFTDRLGVVKPTVLGAIETMKAFSSRGAWVAATAYAVKDLVSSSGTWYVCVVAHTSSASLATDLATKWRVYQGVLSGDLSGSGGSSIVGFIQTGTGALARTVQDKLRERISVLDFGADPTGVADSSAAINLAITYLGYGGELFFPEGTYKCNSAISVPPVSGSQSGMIFTGTGPSSQIIPGASMTSLFNVTGKDVIFNKMGIVNASSYATNGILFTYLSSDAAFSAEVSSCAIGGFTNGISATGQNYDIQNNFFQNNSTHVYFTNDGRNTSIQDNYFLGGQTGIRLSQTVGGTQAEGSRIVNNTLLCTVTGGAQIYIEAGLEIYIGHNIIDQTGASNPGIYVPVSGANAVNRLKVIGNWIAGGLNSYCFFASGNSSDLDLIDNTFAATNGQAVTAGLSLAGTNRAKIALNNWLLAGGVDISTSGCTGLKYLENTATGGGAVENVMGATTWTGNTGYAASAGAGGAVVQATSKSTGVTLNTSCGQITLNNASLAAGASVTFNFGNSLLGAYDVLLLTLSGVLGHQQAYTATVDGTSAGVAAITVKNASGGSLSDAVVINFVIIKGAVN